MPKTPKSTDPEPLKPYRTKRRFDRTPEPDGSPASAPTNRTTRARKKLQFVVQKHRASQLHYDFRLEWDGVLKSWAVPKGPSLDPSVKRFGRLVEDHPIDYAAFEGVIPEGEYGGGTVMVWDRGTWTAEDDDVGESLARGILKFTLAGVKLKGGFALIRFGAGSRDSGNGDKANWLLVKERDRWASTKDLTIEKPCSVVSGRSLAQIAEDEGGVVKKAATGDPSGAPRRCRRLATARKG
jgi:bifunctional non-homologous end joining protein LigD